MSGVQKHTQALTTLVTGIVFIILGVTGWYFFPPQSSVPVEVVIDTTSTTTDPFALEPIVPQARVSTEGWKTCRNEEYGWEVQYPAEWYVYGEGHDNGIWEGRFEVETPCTGQHITLANFGPPNSPDYEKRFSDTEQEGLNIISVNKLFPEVRSEYTNVRDLARSFDMFTLKTIYSIDGYEMVTVQHENQVRNFIFGPTYQMEIISDYPISNILLFETILSTFHFIGTSTPVTE